MTQNSKKSSKTAVGGVITALSIVLMFLTSVIPTLTYALPAAAGFLITLIVIEIDKKWALGVYAARKPFYLFCLLPIKKLRLCI